MFGDESGKSGQDERVVLEEVAGEEVEGDRAVVGVDRFGDRVAVVGFDVAIGGAQEQGGVFFVGLGVGSGFFPDAWQGVVDFVHGDRALGDIDEVAALADEEESDIADFSVARAFEVGGDFRAVSPLFG